MKKILLIITSLLLVLTFTNVKAITKSEFKEGIDALAAANPDATVTMDDSYIHVSTDDVTLQISYDLDANTFTSTIIIPDGVSYEEYTNYVSGIDIGSVILPAYYYSKGITMDDSLSYYLVAALANNVNDPIGEGYEILSYDDELSGSGVEIKESEFASHLNEVLDIDFANPINFNDNMSNLLNLYSETVTRNTTTTANEITTVFTINADSDYSELNGYADKLAESFMPDEIKNLTKDTADYYAELHVGEQLVISSKAGIDGYAFYNDVIDDDEANESDDYNIYKVATKEGTSKFTIDVGDKEYTFYIDVIAAEENTTYSPYEINLDGEEENTEDIATTTVVNDDTEVPETYDSILINSLIGLISISFGALVIYIKRQKSVKSN